MPRHAEDDILKSAITLVEHTLTLDILDRHKRDVINMVLWKITEARGKYTTRIRSTGARDALKGTKLQHEHVIPREELIKSIMREPHRAREFLMTAVACVVTLEEHRRLTAITREQPTLRGWERYEAADISVIDNDTQSE